MRTHERNALVWLVARVSWPWVIKALAVVLAYLLLATVMGCSGSPTGPSGTGHPNEENIAAFTACHADYAKVGDIRVTFQEEPYMVDCATGRAPGGGLASHSRMMGTAPDSQCYAMGWAFPQSNGVTYWGPWVRGETALKTPSTPYTREAVAAHEIGHIRGTWSEAVAEAWAVAAMANTECAG